MDTIIGRYILHEDDDSDTAIRCFTSSIDVKNNVLLRWEWPVDLNIKLALVFDFDEEPPDIDLFLNESRPHAVVTRDLAAEYCHPITGDKRRYMVVPACFGEKRTIIVYKHRRIQTSDFLYRKIKVSSQIAYEPLKMSEYKRVNLTLKISDEARFDEITEQALRYGIYENSRLLGSYPMNRDSISGQYTFYIPKHQRIELLTEKSYAHILEIEKGGDNRG